MKILSTVFLVFFLGCSSSSPQKAFELTPVIEKSQGLHTDSFGINFKLDQRKLPNGLKVIMVSDKSVPLVNYQTWYNVGSVDEIYGQTGLAHFFEHLMFKGTKKYGPKQFFEQLETKGAEVNAFTTRDYTVYHESFTPELLEKVIDMESDRMTHLVIDEVVMKTELQVILEERRLRTENSPAGKIEEALWGLAYSRHPYRWPVIGYAKDLMSLSTRDLMKFYQANYQPGNAIVVIVGNFDPNETFKKIENYYGPISGHVRPERDVIVEGEQSGERRMILRDAVASDQFTIAYHAPSAFNDDSYALDVLMSVLFEGADSRAYRKLVEEKNIATGISGIAFTPTFPGLILISGAMKSGHSAEEIEPELEQLFLQAKTTPVAQADLKKAVRQLTMQVLNGVRSPQGLGRLIGNVSTVFGDPDRFSKDFAKYMKVTADDVMRVANQYLEPNSRSVVIMKRTDSE